MQRVRESEYRELHSRLRSGLVRSLLFVHLTKELEGITIPWVGSKEPPEPPDDPESPPPRTEDWRPTSYEIPRVWQRLLSRIRTDLDAFSEREAYGLMWSGYQMTGQECKASLPDLRSSAQPQNWRFLSVSSSSPEQMQAALELGKD